MLLHLIFELSFEVGNEFLQIDKLALFDVKLLLDLNLLAVERTVLLALLASEVAHCFLVALPFCLHLAGDGIESTAKCLHSATH